PPATEPQTAEGESFPIAGLTDTRVAQLVSKLPRLGDIPIIRHLSPTRSNQKANTELLVLITPNFVRPFAPGETPPLPQFPEGFLGDRSVESGATPAFIGPRGTESSGGKP